MTDEERRVLEHAANVTRAFISSGGLLPLVPMKVDCIAINCHPDNEQDVRAMYDASIVVDPKQKRGTIGVVPHAYAKSITATIGFVNSSED